MFKNMVKKDKTEKEIKPVIKSEVEDEIEKEIVEKMEVEELPKVKEEIASICSLSAKETHPVLNKIQNVKKESNSTVKSPSKQTTLIGLFKPKAAVKKEKEPVIERTDDHTEEATDTISSNSDSKKRKVTSSSTSATKKLKLEYHETNE